MMKKMNVKLSPVSFIKYYETIEESQSSSNQRMESSNTGIRNQVSQGHGENKAVMLAIQSINLMHQASIRRGRSNRKLKAKQIQEKITEIKTIKTSERSTNRQQEKQVSDSSPQIRISKQSSTADLPPRKAIAQNQSTTDVNHFQYQHIFNWGNLV